MSNKLLLLYYKMLEKLSFQLLTNLEEYTHTTPHTNPVCVCVFADQFNTT